MLARHCDGPRCDTWQRLGEEELYPLLGSGGWIELSWFGQDAHLCSWRCLANYTEERLARINANTVKSSG